MKEVGDSRDKISTFLHVIYPSIKKVIITLSLFILYLFYHVWFIQCEKLIQPILELPRYETLYCSFEQFTTSDRLVNYTSKGILTILFSLILLPYLFVCILVEFIMSKKLQRWSYKIKGAFMGGMISLFIFILIPLMFVNEYVSWTEFLAERGIMPWNIIVMIISIFITQLPFHCTWFSFGGGGCN